MSLAEPATRAAARAKESEYVRVLAAPTGDAIAAAALLVTAFRRDGIDAHVSFVDDLAPPPVERLVDDSVVFVLDGWHRAEAGFGPLAERAILISHDEGGPPEPMLVLDAARGGLDGGAEATCASLAYLVAHAFDKRNADLVFLALAGAAADRHRLDVGLHASLASEAQEAGLVRRRKDLALAGPLGSALAGPDPFLKGVSGRARGARQLCADLRLDPEAPVETLEDAERVRLASALALHLLEQGAAPSAVDALFATDAIASTGPLADESALRLGASLAHAAASGGAADACVALVAGGKPKAGAIDVLPSLIRAEREPSKPIEAPWGSAAAVADSAATCLAAGRPVLSFESRDGITRVAAAGSRESKVDVGRAFREAAGDRAVVAGNRRAARARMDAGVREAFVADVLLALDGGR